MALKSTRRKIFIGLSFVSPWLIGFFIFTIGPVLYSLYLSFTDYQVLLPPRWIGTENFKVLFRDDPLFWKSLYNTAYYVLFRVPTGIILALLLAILLNQRYRGVTIFRSIFYFPSLISGVVLSVIWLWILSPEFGILNMVLSAVGIKAPLWLTDPKWSKLAFVIMSLWSVGPQMIIFLAGLQDIPEQLYEAAHIDGSNWWQDIRYITLPMITPSLFYNIIVLIIGAFQVFTQAFIMTNGGPLDSTLFYVLYLYNNGFRYFRMGYASAMAWILFVIIFSLTLLQFRYSSWVHYER